MANKNVELKLVPNKEGVLVPEDTVASACGHNEVAQRFGQRFVQQKFEFVCKDCKDKVQVRIMNYVVLNKEQMEALMQMQAQVMMEKQRRDKVGLILPGEQK